MIAGMSYLAVVVPFTGTAVITVLIELFGLALVILHSLHKEKQLEEENDLFENESQL